MSNEPSAQRKRFDLRTLAVAVAIHGGFILWSLYFTAMPLWLAALTRVSDLERKAAILQYPALR